MGGVLGHGRTMRSTRPDVARSEFAGFRFPAEVITLAVRWYLRYNLSYRDLEELLAERGIEVDHTSVYRWVRRFTPLFIEAARPCRHVPGDRWQVDETYVKVDGAWRYLYRALDQFGQVIDVYAEQATRPGGGPPVLPAGADRRRRRAGRGDHRPGRRSTRACSTSWSPPPATSPTATPTTGWRPTTAGSRPGCARCAA